ncbi:high-affinity choline transporter 1-like isoform X1 [Mya arenaria]|uniref:high-affinity choline transporter 1-like isoform X1 n=2 Tax=Mya arenaria TaxID=6604 RepID=UPI0022E1B756|nr:high-affinity choline transporter 1-like isoform X1 [Mya arenaria]XP_052805567.1 high-affinity choline transporter 1-like isoform X1 [Mya arenaria]XP_052805568.1 high-affinity choline transporter 1-like isoform X1 [Mya arenaria]
MEVNVAALVVLICFYLVILVVGVLAARWKGHTGQPSLESSIVADRNIPTSVGIFTMTATIVGGGYVNGTAESVATGGLLWTLVPFGIFLGLITGGLVYAGPMRERNYMTMLDPFYERFGSVVVFLVYLASLVGDLFWTASILIALGTSLSVIINIELTVAIVTSAGVTVAYTMVGQMISVAYTDVVQLFFIMFGLALSIPFVLTNEHVGSIKATSDVWVGELPSSAVLPWIDLFIAMTFGTIPWQSYMQRVLSVKGKRQAQVLSVVGGCLSLILVVPSIIIGAASTSADWKATSLGVSPLDADKSSMVLPYVLNEFTPKAVSILGLGAISAAVMSSMDSSILGSSSMFTYNIYRQIFRPQASPVELLWAQRLAILVLGVVATGISLHVPIIYGLFVMAGDIVFVIVLPQLTCALFVPMSNGYGAVCGYVLGIVLRIGAGEPFLNLDPYIRYPSYSETDGQVFPFRVFTVCCTFITMIGVSFVANILFRKDILPEYFDILRNFKREAGGSSASLGLDQHHPVVKSFHENPSYRVSTHM